MSEFQQVRRVGSAPARVVEYSIAEPIPAGAPSTAASELCRQAPTDITSSFEASRARDHGWFTLEMVCGLTGLPRVEAMGGGEVGALAVPVDSNDGGRWNRYGTASFE